MPELTIGVDIGGSGVRAARWDVGDGLGPVASRPLSRDQSTAEVMIMVMDAIDEVRGEAPLSPLAVGVSFPGFMDRQRRAIFCVNLPGLNGVNLEQHLQELLLTQRVAALPDLSAATLAEARQGAGRNHSRVLCVAIGTGLNAGATVDGQLLVTAFDALGDAGHIVIADNGPSCRCGGRGCVEAVCSAWALEREAERLGLGSIEQLMHRATAGHVAEAEAVGDAGRALGRALASWSAMLAPDIAIVGGGVATVGVPLLEIARQELRLVGVPYLTSALEVVPAEFGPAAALVGAALHVSLG